MDEVVVGTGQHTVKGYGPFFPTFAGLGRALGMCTLGRGENKAASGTCQRAILFHPAVTLRAEPDGKGDRAGRMGSRSPPPAHFHRWHPVSGFGPSLELEPRGPGGDAKRSELVPVGRKPIRGGGCGGDASEAPLVPLGTSFVPINFFKKSITLLFSHGYKGQRKTNTQ